MGNQGGRLRSESGTVSSRSRHRSSLEDTTPVQLNLASKKGSGSGGGSNRLSLSDLVGPNVGPGGYNKEFPVVVKWPASSAKNVYVTGAWNKYKGKIPLVKSRDDFTTILNLPEGRHEFRYNVDGAWRVTKQFPIVKGGTTGGGGGGGAGSTGSGGPPNFDRNVIVIDRADFEIFDALDKDLADSGNAPEGLVRVEGLPTTRFEQTIPERRQFETPGLHPPVLPPHLLHVILNKETPYSVDPNCLPEPNHVMLNHLYALSIKEGVMVLSATHRYQKKYVTTLLYKPT